MSDTETIELRRYPSRKLYNKTASSYVRLPEVAEMIRKGANIRVEDTETGEDVTRQVLLQIIMEQEGHSDQAILSANLMTDMIRMNQTKASEMMTGLFEQSVAFMRAQQEQLANSMSSSLSQTPWGGVFDPAQMQAMQAEFQKRLAGLWTGALPGMGVPGMGMPPMPGATPTRKPEAAVSPAADAAELKALRERLEELEKKLKK
jgi:polyhydroxyalkanoate synthesis repressor PhaR